MPDPIVEPDDSHEGLATGPVDRRASPSSTSDQQLQSRLRRRTAEVWDETCGVPVVRLGAAMLAGAMAWMAWHYARCFFDGDFDIARALDAFLFLSLLPFLFLLAIVAILGRSWRIALPRWRQSNEAKGNKPHY